MSILELEAKQQAEAPALIGALSWAPAALIAWCGLLFFYGLPSGEFYRNETLRAILGRGMLDSGDWIVPRLYGEPIFTKPPLMYWAIALCSLPFGAVTEWSARLPSALAATATVFLFYWMVKRHLGSRAGLAASLILPLSVFWLERAPSAEIDMLQVMWVTASMAFFLRGLSETSARRVPISLGGFAYQHCSLDSIPWRWALSALICVAAGALTKWTAPAFFYATVVPLLWWRGQLRVLWSWQHLVAASAAALLVLAWIGAAVWQTSWAELYDTVSNEALQHLAPGHGRHALPLADMLLHPFKVLAANLPWSLLALWTLRRDCWRTASGGERFLLQAFHCWLWPNVVFWSLASEHSLRHTAPVCPAIVGLAAIAGLRSARNWRWRVQPRSLLISCLAFWFTLKVLFVNVVVVQRSEFRQARAKGTLLASLVPLEHILYVLRLKDEGLMFYYGRPVVRVRHAGDLPATPGPHFCILTADEWSAWTGPCADAVCHLRDAQGDPIVLVRLN